MTPTTNRILLAINLSRNSTRALSHAVAMARATGAEIRVLNVLEALSEDARMTLTMFVQDAEARQQAITRRHEMAQEALTAWLDEFWASRPPADRQLRDRIVAAEVVEGFPAEAILSETRRHGCDLIVMGAHEHGLTHTFLGTVAKRVLRRAEVPTLVVPYRDDG